MSPKKSNNGVLLPKIKELDAEILRKLLMDGRTSYDELAEICKVSKNKVWKRCRSMEKRGIIKGATTQIHFGKFGYDALVTLLIRVDPQQVDQAMEILQKVTEIRSYRQYNSLYNLRAIATLRDLNELDSVKHVIREKLPTMNFKTYIWAGIRTIPENLNLSGPMSRKHHRVTIKAIDKEHATSIDETDLKIAEALRQHGRASFSKIAEMVGLSTHTVIKRYEMLKKNGALKVSIQISPSKLGYSSLLDLNVAFTTMRGLSTNIVDLLSKIPDVVSITRTSGDFDLQVTAMIRDLKQVFSIQEEIARIIGVTQIEASLRKTPDRWPTPQQYISTI
jgi:DNA-binding Lrp family transcriptional regulator